MPTLDLDWRLRLAAFHVLERLRRAGDGLVTGGQLTDGFEFEGERIPFFNLRMGIWKPRQAESALTIVTAPPKPGRKPPSDDQLASDAEGTDPEYWTNAAARETAGTRTLWLLRPLPKKTRSATLSLALPTRYDTRGDRRMDALIRCTLKPGTFSTEFAVTIPSTSSGPISFFVDKSFVEFSGGWPTDKGAEGGLKVALLKEEPDYSLIQLPPQSSLASRVRVPKDSFLANSR